MAGRLLNLKGRLEMFARATATLRRVASRRVSEPVCVCVRLSGVVCLQPKLLAALHVPFLQSILLNDPERAGQKKFASFITGLPVRSFLPALPRLVARLARLLVRGLLLAVPSSL